MRITAAKPILFFCCLGLILVAAGCVTREYVPVGAEDNPDYWRNKYEQERAQSTSREDRDYEREQTKLLREEQNRIEEGREALRERERDKTCPTCGGAGELVCPVCRGRLYLGRCNACSGSGKRACPNYTPGERNHCRHDHDSRGRIFCVACMGTGKERCSKCMYIGNPKGTIQCTRCSGRGTIR